MTGAILVQFRMKFFIDDLPVRLTVNVNDQTQK